jgi:hypothetical protein
MPCLPFRLPLPRHYAIIAIITPFSMPMLYADADAAIIDAISPFHYLIYCHFISLMPLILRHHIAIISPCHYYAFAIIAFDAADCCR